MRSRGDLDCREGGAVLGLAFAAISRKLMRQPLQFRSLSTASLSHELAEPEDAQPD
jgi:hypothetical protein